MVEEFHADDSVVPKQFKQLYGWDPLNTNVWLPSLSELIGTTGTQSVSSGCYKSAMQGLNTSTGYSVDSQGGTQFAYFQQYNAVGGGEAIWNACGQRATWLRSPHYSTEDKGWQITSAQRFDWAAPTVADSRAVHPAVEDK